MAIVDPEAAAAAAVKSPSAHDGLSRRAIYLHGSLAIPLAIYGYPLAIWLPPYYGASLGSLALVGTLLMLARFTDVFTDPLMGEISDRGRTRFGRRKPYMVLGAPCLMVSAWFLFVPPDGAGVLYLL